MIEILVLILVIAAVGCVVAFAVKTLRGMGASPIWENLIYLVVAIALIFYVIHALQTGHLPSVKVF